MWVKFVGSLFCSGKFFFFLVFPSLQENVCLNRDLKAFIDSARVKSVKLKDEFCSRLLWLSVLPWCGERSQIVIL